MGYFGKVISMWGGPLSRLLGCRSLRSRLLDQPRHIADIWLDLARAIGVSPDGLKPEIFLSEGEKESASQMLSYRFGAKKFIIIHPGCSGNTCNLPIGVYAELVNKFLEWSNVAVVLSGITAERDKYKSELSCNDQNPRVWNSMGELNLRQLCAVISKAELVVSVGTAPLHVASALGIPTVSPFCRKVGVCSRVWGNLGAKSIAIEPPANICNECIDKKHCDFKGSININQFLKSCLDLINIS
jgi:hypothetical protein